MTVTNQTKERLIDKLRNELYKKSWGGSTAVDYMVPIILAIRHKDDETDPDAILGALDELRQRGTRELEDTLFEVKTEYQDVSPLLNKTLKKMITGFNDLPYGTVHEVLDYLHHNPALLRAFRDEDFIGTFFERSVSDAFRGDDGRFFTPRNIILIVTEMTRLLESKQCPDRRVSEFSLCDPCCGSARFLIYWSGLIVQEIREKDHLTQHIDIRARLKEIATKSLFGADVHPETAAYGCLNMMLHGDGATNIANLDSLNHFGFFADMPLLHDFAGEFEEKWKSYTEQQGVTGADLQLQIEAIEAKREVISALIGLEEIDLSDPKWLEAIDIIRTLLKIDREYPTEWDAIRDLQRRSKLPAVYEKMLEEWAAHNPDVARGFDIVTTNPPFGRQADLMIDDIFILSQYKLATEMWVQDMSKTMTEELLDRTLAKDIGLPAYYIELVKAGFGKEYVEDLDEVSFDRLMMSSLQRLAEANDVMTEGLKKKELVAKLTESLGRGIVYQVDDVSLIGLLASETKRVCSEYLYDGYNPGPLLADQIISHFGKEWLTVEDIEGPDGYQSKVTLVFNEEPHTIYYDDDGQPIVYKNSLPKQVLFIEQFLRMVKPGGKVFTVLDTGVLSNIGDEYVRQFIYRYARVHAIVEFPHGAFKAAEANVKTAVMLLEKGEFDMDYEFFGSLPDYLGYRLNDQNVPPIAENDLGKVLCDYSIHLGLGPLLPECANEETDTNLSDSECHWHLTRNCAFWEKYVEREEG